MKLEYLSFDSELFDYPVYSFHWDQQHIFDFKQFAQVVGDAKSRLTYVFSKYPLNDMNGFPLHLMDCKLTLIKFELDISPIVVSAFEPKLDSYEELLALTLVSGEYSRFRLDSHFLRGEYKKLYKTWLDRSLDGTVADTILIVRKEARIAGFATCQFARNEVKIGLLAVHPKFQRQGVGVALLQQVESLAIQNSFDSISTQTQKDNTPAVQFYKNHGYRVTDQTYVYHYWQT